MKEKKLLKIECQDEKRMWKKNLNMSRKRIDKKSKWKIKTEEYERNFWQKWNFFLFFPPTYTE